MLLKHVRVTSISTESGRSGEAALVLYPSSRESYCQPEFWQWQSLALQILAACHTQTHIWALHPPCITTNHCAAPAHTVVTSPPPVWVDDGAVKLCSRKEGRTTATGPARLWVRPSGSPSPESVVAPALNPN